MSKAAMQLLAIKDLEEDPDNSRKLFDKHELENLADSIKAHTKALPETGGLIEPIVVRPVGKGVSLGGKWRIVAGHRRVRALQALGRKEVAAIVHDLDDKQAALAQATENLQRADLTPLEEARAFQRLIDLGMEKKKIGELAGVAFNTIKARLQLLQLPEDLAARVGRDGFSHAHAQLLLPLAKDPKAVKVAADAMHDGVEILPLDEAGPAATQALVREKILVDVEHAAGLQYSHDGHAKARLTKLEHETHAFAMPGEYGRTAKVALRTPEVLALVKEQKAKSTELNKKRRASYGYSTPTPSVSAEERAKQEREKAFTQRIEARARQLAGAALMKGSEKVTTTHIVDVLGRTLLDDLDHEQLAAARALGMEVREPKDQNDYDVLDDVEPKLKVMEPGDAVWAMLVLSVWPRDGYAFGKTEQGIVGEISGKTWSEWVSAAKVQVREEDKASKGAQKTKKSKLGKEPCIYCGKKSKVWYQDLLICDTIDCYKQAEASSGTKADDGSHDPATPGPRFGEPGRCMECGCTEDDACDPACSWANAEKTVCSTPACVQAAAAAGAGGSGDEALELVPGRRAGSEPELQAVADVGAVTLLSKDSGTGTCATCGRRSLRIRTDGTPFPHNQPMKDGKTQKCATPQLAAPVVVKPKPAKKTKSKGKAGKGKGAK